MILAALPLLVSTGIFYLYHKYPSKIFLGDSGTLALGSMYGALAISGGVEIVAVVALFPAILNSFFFLSSVRRIVDHREIKVRPTKMLEDYKIAAVEDHRAPVTLVRLILSDGPLSENQITFSIFKLAIVSSLLAVITSLLIR
jgi:UDP-N-acetylglucosamine--dolichyl-phosphate N-acetylglucosaminephosphotransferase